MSTQRQTVLFVEGMTCGSCVRHINDVLGGLEGVTEIDVKLREGKVRVRHDTGRASVTSLIGALGEAGYDGREADRQAELRARVDGLNRMILEGKVLEAIDEYYHDDVIMQENEAEPTRGKASNREREKEFLENIVEWRGAAIKAVAVGDEVTMVELHYDYTHKEWGPKRYSQVAVQRWIGDRIIHERFYYGA